MSWAGFFQFHSLRPISLTGYLLTGLMVAWSAFGDSPQALAESFFSPANGSLSSGFGWRKDPINGRHRFHSGIDIAAESGQPVYTPQKGIVVFSGRHGGYGNVVVIQHTPKLFTLYGHNAFHYVQPGQHVQAGQVIAAVGSTGRSTGPHLHFEVHHNKQYLNPLQYLSHLQRVTGYQFIQPNRPHIAQKKNQPAVPVPAYQGGPVPRQPLGKQVQVIRGQSVQTLHF